MLLVQWKLSKEINPRNEIMDVERKALLNETASHLMTLSLLGKL